MIRLDGRPAMEPGGFHLDRFDVLDRGRLAVRRTRRPLGDAARALLAEGVEPSTLVTIRHEGAAVDSWRPVPIGDASKWTVKERDRGGLGRERWEPRPTASRSSPVRPRTADDDAAGRMVAGAVGGAP